MSCPACDGTGEKFEGDVHAGPCPLCGGSGEADEIFEDEPDENYEDEVVTE